MAEGRFAIGVYITAKDRDEAKEISRVLLEKRLIACANLSKIESMYWWKGEIAQEPEYAILAKARKEDFEEIRKEVRLMHSYEVPCICAYEIFDLDKDYLDWLEKETKK